MGPFITAIARRCLKPTTMSGQVQMLLNFRRQL